MGHQHVVVVGLNYHNKSQAVHSKSWFTRQFTIFETPIIVFVNALDRLYNVLSSTQYIYMTKLFNSLRVSIALNMLRDIDVYSSKPVNHKINVSQEVFFLYIYATITSSKNYICRFLIRFYLLSTNLVFQDKGPLMSTDNNAFLVQTHSVAYQ